MDEPVFEHKETSVPQNECQRLHSDSKAWNHLVDAAECVLQGPADSDTASENDKLAHCDVSLKDTKSSPPVHLNGLVQNHIDHNHQAKSHGKSTSGPSCAQDLNLSGDHELEDTYKSNCDSLPSEMPGDLETNVSHKDVELQEISALSLGNSTQVSDSIDGINYVVYQSELQMPGIMRLITKDLSEPYSIYTYRYFIHNWPKLCFLAMDEDKCVGAIVCKLDLHKKVIRRGYIAMLAVDQQYRRKGIGSYLVLKAIRAMTEDECDEVVLETEITNKGALRLYENLGFVRDKRLFRYYLNGVDALRLKLWLS